MKKVLLFTAGITLLLVAGGVWVYLFVYGAPESTQQLFSNFGINGGEQQFEPTGETPIITDDALVVNNDATQILRQLTLKPVAGAVFVDDAVRYVERGTGHIFDIALASGAETNVTGSTKTGVTRALFSGRGNRVALISESPSGSEVFVGTITKNDDGDGILDGKAVSKNGSSVSFDTSGDSLNFIEKTGGSATGKQVNVLDGAVTTLFTLPLRDVHVLWGKETYVIPEPSALLDGNVYMLKNDILQPQRARARGLMAFPYSSGIIYTTSVDNDLVSYAETGTNTIQQPFGIFPEKCTEFSADAPHLLCAAPYVLPRGVFPDDWYKGAVTLEDGLWDVNIERGEATLLADPLSDAGRVVDVEKIITNDSGPQFLLINKVDSTLWLFEPRQ
jgi:hypothetical protein